MENKHHIIITKRQQLGSNSDIGRVTKDIAVILKSDELFLKWSDKYHITLIDKGVKLNNIWIVNNFFLMVIF